MARIRAVSEPQSSSVGLGVIVATVMAFDVGSVIINPLMGFVQYGFAQMFQKPSNGVAEQSFDALFLRLTAEGCC